MNIKASIDHRMPEWTIAKLGWGSGFDQGEQQRKPTPLTAALRTAK
jgi:hypothetical protein